MDLDDGVSKVASGTIDGESRGSFMLRWFCKCLGVELDLCVDSESELTSCSPLYPDRKCHSVEYTTRRPGV